MDVGENILLIVGSLKKEHSASAFIGMWLVDLLKRKNMKCNTFYLDDALDAKKDKLFSEINRANIIVLSAPLYIDGPPYLVTKTMEYVAEQHKNISNSKQFIAITNGGYPEAHHNSVALSIYRKFADQMHFKWMGGLYLGMGAVFSVTILRRIGFILGLFRNMGKGLEQSAEFISEGKPVPADAIERIAKPYISIWIYSFLARSVAKILALKNKISNIYYKPY